jgi:hypothetical protein
MPRKSYKPGEIVTRPRQVDVLTSQGRSVAEAIRSIGVSEVTYSAGTRHSVRITPNLCGAGFAIFDRQHNAPGRGTSQKGDALR